MPICKRLSEFLDENRVKYMVIAHSRAYTAQEIAASVSVPGKDMVKSVIVKADGEFIMVALPADYNVNFNLLKSALSKKDVTLATEDEFKALFPDCEVGAMPPFGNLYNVPVYISQTLDEGKEIVFNGGTHTEAVRMSMQDYKQLVNPQIVKFSEHL